MTEKDTVSMATVQMKPDLNYAASEVYSTASEAPPFGLFNFNHQAYKRQSNSVKIAKITAFTIIVSSFILGAFILASSYLQAKASCDQVQALDSVLEKELMLETLQQVNKELPRAEALMGREAATDEADLQSLDKEEPARKVSNNNNNMAKPNIAVVEEEPSDTDNSYSDSEEADEAHRFPGKLPLELDLSELAAALLRNNKKSRMNCVVERKHAEEIVDSPAKTVALPFGMNLTTDPKKARITGERISIFCDGGNEERDEPRRPLGSANRGEEDEDTEEDAEPIRPMFVPYQRVPIPFGQIPQQFPLTHMPQRMMPPMQQQQQQQPIVRQLPPPFQQMGMGMNMNMGMGMGMGMRPPMPPQVMQAPLPERPPMLPMAMHEQPPPQTLRIHVQQIPIREIHVADDMPVQIPQQRQELPRFQVQRLPLGLALQRAGITAEDLQNIQRMAEYRITDELRRLAAEESADSSESAAAAGAANNNMNMNMNMNMNGNPNANINMHSNDNDNSEEEDSSDSQASQMASNEQQAAENAAGPQDMPEPRMQPPQRLILQQLPEQPRDTMTPPMPEQPSQPMMQFGRAAYGRSLAQPVRIPVPMMQQQADMSHDSMPLDAERPHFVQPRSV